MFLKLTWPMKRLFSHRLRNCPPWFPCFPGFLFHLLYGVNKKIHPQRQGEVEIRNGLPEFFSKFSEHSGHLEILHEILSQQDLRVWLSNKLHAYVAGLWTKHWVARKRAPYEIRKWKVGRGKVSFDEEMTEKGYTIVPHELMEGPYLEAHPYSEMYKKCFIYLYSSCTSQNSLLRCV